MLAEAQALLVTFKMLHDNLGEKCFDEKHRISIYAYGQRVKTFCVLSLLRLQ
jgi:hypothetical protein